MICPGQQIDGDPAFGALANGPAHLRIAEPLRDTAELQGIFAIIDAARGIDRQNQLQIHRLGPGWPSGGQEHGQCRGQRNVVIKSHEWCDINSVLKPAH